MHVLTNSLTSVLCISTLTLAHVGRVEGYCSQVFCVCVSFTKISGQLTTLGL